MKTRPGFLKLGAAAVAPTILGAADKSDRKRPILGSGDHAYEAIHDWGRVPSHIKLGNTHGIVEDSRGASTFATPFTQTARATTPCWSSIKTENSKLCKVS